MITPHEILAGAAVASILAGLLIGRYGMPSLSARQLAYADTDDLAAELAERGWGIVPAELPDDDGMTDDEAAAWCYCGDDRRAGLHGTDRCLPAPELLRRDPLAAIESGALRVTAAVDQAALDRIEAQLAAEPGDDWAETLHAWNQDPGPAPELSRAGRAYSEARPDRAPAGPDYLAALSDAEFWHAIPGLLQSARDLAAAPWRPLPAWQPRRSLIDA